ncbi:MAG: cyclic nucleotide-binding domain-containing protein [Candidatus Hydrogenedentota bacterium]|nr:MAG: cyclic nucleotide-binding domain-containing protein [Candidatus Hydrogenedentota bacterium]
MIKGGMGDEDKKGALLTAEELPRFDEMLDFLTNAEVQLLYEHLEERELAPDEVLFEQGGEGQTLYIIKSGRIRIVIENEDGTRNILTHLSTGHIIGEIAFLMGTTHSATAEADGPASLYLLHRNHFDSIVLEDPTLAFKIIQAINKVLCYRLSRVNRELSQILHGNADKK